MQFVWLFKFIFLFISFCKINHFFAESEVVVEQLYEREMLFSQQYLCGFQTRKIKAFVEYGEIPLHIRYGLYRRKVVSSTTKQLSS